ncbi:Penicillinase repressor [Maioricimonas rarisocia]|uniref:Penicillinase repressor n=1 Tax=Maioricimonas rarisocia TaxID=2528026 RepID=A0A517Z9W7_9PLAN|nr:BlaI/MecI/CopY family transcriptional regulator [Maioricimonas rarisocia]QDU39241.1 Penicillinase repressor [Maioricimonas rarisocia]
MARPASEQPTPAELEVLKILWEIGPATVRQVLGEFERRNDRRAYTTIMSLMNVMADKKLLKRTPRGRAYVYTAIAPREKTLQGMVGDLWQRAFEGSAASLVTRLLQESKPTREELDLIREAIGRFEQEQEEDQ